jgi:hypothetical protein
MPRKVDLIAENPILQAGQILQKDLGSAATQIKETYRKAAVAYVLEGLGALNQPPDWQKKADRLKEMQNMYKGLPQSGDPAVIASQVYARNMQVQALQMQDQLEEQQRQSLKEKYVNDNLAVFSQLTDGEKAAVSYAFPKIHGQLASFGGGGGFGHGGGGNKKLEAFQMGGKNVVGSFDEATGAFIPIREEFDPKEMAATMLLHSQAGKENTAAYENMMKATQYDMQGRSIAASMVSNKDAGIDVQPIPDNYQGSPEDFAKARQAALRSMGDTKSQVWVTHMPDGHMGVAIKNPALVRRTGGGGSSAGATRPYSESRLIQSDYDKRATSLAEADGIIQGFEAIRTNPLQPAPIVPDKDGYYYYKFNDGTEVRSPNRKVFLDQIKAHGDLIRGNAVNRTLSTKTMKSH